MLVDRHADVLTCAATGTDGTGAAARVPACVSRTVRLNLATWNLGCVFGWDAWVEQARKRQLIEQRLQDKLRKETDSVRRAEEAKKDKNVANRKEEELQLKDSIVRFFYVILGNSSLSLELYSINFAGHDFRS